MGLPDSTCRTIDEYLTCWTLEPVESRTHTILRTHSFESLLSNSCLRIIAAKGAPTHLCSTFNDCIDEIEALSGIYRNICFKHHYRKQLTLDNNYLHRNLVIFLPISKNRIQIYIRKPCNQDWCIKCRINLI